MTKTRTPAAVLPVARVMPLLGISHLDRLFDYQIDTELDAECQPGVRVRIRFGGRLVDGIVIDRVPQSEHGGRLVWVDRVISPDKVYTPEIAKTVELLRERYAGITSDIVRAAIPSRHAAAERSDTTSPWESLGEVQEPDLSPWAIYQHGTSFVDAVLRQDAARAAWQIVPGTDWARAFASLAAKTAIDGAGALIVVPDQRDLDQLEEALHEFVSAKQVTVLHAALGPQARYRRYLSILHGQARLVIGTRSAAFAPVHNLQLLCVKDDGDESLVDPRAPYMHAREVLSTRASVQGCSFVIGSLSRTAETQLLVNSGWMHDVVATRATIRQHQPRVHAVEDEGKRLPNSVFAAVRASLQRGKPVLFQVPRKGYIPTLACQNCRFPARCRHCGGPMGAQEDMVPTCRWCGRLDTHLSCVQCGSSAIRAVVLGSDRTAEELGRAFTGTRVIMSGGSRIVDSVEDAPAIVVATPGAEPRGKYGAAILLDTWALLSRQDLRAHEETLASWANVVSLVEPAHVGGEVLVVAAPDHPVVQALIRFDMVGAAQRELAQRQEVHLPPAVHLAAIDGPMVALEEFLQLLQLPEHAEVLGPVDLPPGVGLPGEYDRTQFGVPQRMLIRSSLQGRAALGKALRAGLVARAARKDSLPLRVQVDPIRVG